MELNLRSLAAAGAAALLFAGVAGAQTAAGSTAAAQPSRGYVEGDVQSAFGNVTSQSFGGEIGIALTDQIQVWAEFARVRDVSPAALGADAQAFAGALSQTVTGLQYQVREPVTFGVVGARYLFPIQSRAVPYVLGGIGAGQVKRDVTFSVNGTDVTSNLSQYGAVLGTGLSGSSTSAMIVLGGGVQVPLWERLVVDLQYRYGRIFTPDAGTNVNRAGIGIGFRF